MSDELPLVRALSGVNPVESPDGALMEAHSDLVLRLWRLTTQTDEYYRLLKLVRMIEQEIPEFPEWLTEAY